MQKLYDLLHVLAQSIKGRFGYSITIKQAVLTAYFAFLAAVFVELTGLIGMAYITLSASFPISGGIATAVFPSPSVVSGGLTAYIGVLIFKKATSYTINAWGAWVSTSK